MSIDYQNILINYNEEQFDACNITQFVEIKGIGREYMGNTLM